MMETVPAIAPGGWIYIIMTRSDGDRVKIGKTKGNPIDRLAKLRCGDPYLAMIGAFFIPESKGKIKQVEKYVHSWFAEKRIRFQEHIRSHGGSPAYTLDDPDLIPHSEWFTMDPREAEHDVRGALQSCLAGAPISVASWFNAGSFPCLAFYTQDMLTQMFGKPANIDDDYELGDEFEDIPWDAW